MTPTEQAIHNEIQQMSDEEVEMMMQMYNEYAIFPTWLDFFEFLAVIWLITLGLYVIARLIHYKRRCKRLERQIARMEADIDA